LGAPASFCTMSIRTWFLTLLLSVAVTIGSLLIFIRVLTSEVAAAAPAAPPAVPTVVAQEPAADTPAPVGIETPTSTVQANEAANVNEAVGEVDISPTIPPPSAAAPTPKPAVSTAPAVSGTVKVIISAVRQPGQRTSEFVVVVNEADPVEMTGWTLEGSNGRTYTFPNFVLFRNTFVRINTMTGTDRPMNLFWGQNEAVWKVGDVIVLKNGDREMARFTVK